MIFSSDNIIFLLFWGRGVVLCLYCVSKCHAVLLEEEGHNKNEKQNGSTSISSR